MRFKRRNRKQFLVNQICEYIKAQDDYFYDKSSNDNIKIEIENNYGIKFDKCGDKYLNGAIRHLRNIINPFSNNMFIYILEHNCGFKYE